MLKIFKWIYQLGVTQERRRIELLISQYKEVKPERPIDPENIKSDRDMQRFRNYDRDLSVWIEVNNLFENVVNSGEWRYIPDKEPEDIHGRMFE